MFDRSGGYVPVPALVAVPTFLASSGSLPIGLFSGGLDLGSRRSRRRSCPAPPQPPPQGDGEAQQPQPLRQSSGHPVLAIAAGTPLYPRPGRAAPRGSRSRGSRSRRAVRSRAEPGAAPRPSESASEAIVGGLHEKGAGLIVDVPETRHDAVRPGVEEGGPKGIKRGQ